MRLNEHLTAENYRILFSWLFNAKKEVEPVIKFIMLWVCFNHWYASYLKKDVNKLTDRHCINKVKEDFQLIRSVFNKINLGPAVGKPLYKFAEIRNKKRNNKYSIEYKYGHIMQGQENFGNIFENLYDLRNSLFHGDMQFDSQECKEECQIASEVLYYFLGRWIFPSIPVDIRRVMAKEVKNE